MDPIERLSRIFERFPGIGPRQAQRFVQHLLRSSQTTRRELMDALQHLGGSVHPCPSCYRFHASEEKLCSICTDPKRDGSQLAVVASDADLMALEHSGTFSGRYFVLGGTISLASEKTDGLRLRQLIDTVKVRSESGLKEIILAFPANPEGDATAVRVREELQEQLPNLTVTALGRGLSTGSELEYADAETLKSAFEARR